MSTTETRRVPVRAEPLTAEAFAPFGRIVDESQQVLHCDPGQYTARVHTLEPIKPVVERINRHFDHEQLFVPLTDNPLLIVVAPKEMSEADFDPTKVRIFRNDTRQGWTFAVGVWHIAPRTLPDAGEAQVINVQGSQYMAHTEDIAMPRAVEVQL